jgi:solute carrier family 50 protein (sugar transporter)
MSTTTTFVSLVGSVLNIFLFLSPWKQLSQFKINAISPTSQAAAQDTLNDLSSFPYICMTINCLFWITYSIMNHNSAILFVNGLGFILSVYYQGLFFNITERKEQFITHCSISLLIYIVALSYVLFAVQPKNMIQQLGFMAAFASIVMIAAPLSQIRMVIKKKNADAIPYLFTLAATSGSITWWIYGVMVQDKNIYYPNALGAILGGLQLLLKLAFRSGKKPQVFSLLPTTEPEPRTVKK